MRERDYCFIPHNFVYQYGVRRSPYQKVDIAGIGVKQQNTIVTHSLATIMHYPKLDL